MMNENDIETHLARIRNWMKGGCKGDMWSTGEGHTIYVYKRDGVKTR